MLLSLLTAMALLRQWTVQSLLVVDQTHSVHTSGKLALLKIDFSKQIAQAAVAGFVGGWSYSREFLISQSNALTPRLLV